MCEFCISLIPAPSSLIPFIPVLTKILWKFGCVTRRRAVTACICGAWQLPRDAQARKTLSARGLIEVSERLAARRINACLGNDEIHRNVVLLRVNRWQPQHFVTHADRDHAALCRGERAIEVAAAVT